MGTLGFADALEAGIFTTRVKPRGAGTANLDLELKGSTSEPVLAGAVKTARVEVEAPRVVLSATEVVVAIELDRRGLRWSGLEASIAQGRLTGSGVIDSTGHATDVKFAAIKVDELPLGIDPALLRGIATGALSLRGVADKVDKLDGTGPIEIASPEYGFLSRASESFATFGLPALPVRGNRPLRARVELSEGRVVLRNIEGGVEGLRFDGSVEISWKGRLSGRIDARLEERYLRRSLVLAIPAMFTGEVSVPLEISGDASAPQYSADLVGTVGRLVTENSVTGAITGIVDGILGNLLGGERPASDDKRRPKRGGIDGFFDSLLG
jgi:autotransporter translocation and assembly factor TamB